MKLLFFHIFTLLLIGSVSFFFTACNDDDEVITPADRLVGTWTMQSVNVDFIINDQDYETYIQQLPDLSDQEKAFLIAYIEALIQQEIENLGIPQGTTFQFDADNDYEVKAPNETPETGKWELNEDGTLLTIDEGTQNEIEFEVDTLTETSLVLSYSTVDQDDIDEDGDEDTLTTKITFNLSK